MTEIDARDVFESYVQVVSGSSPGVIRDAADLPYPKQIIQQVLEGLLQRFGSDPSVREQIGVAYVILADYQPLTEEEKSALSVWQSQTEKAAGTSPGEELKNMAEQLASVGDTALAVMERARDEAERYNRRVAEITASITRTQS